MYNKPVLLVGNGARLAGASELIYEFAHKTHIPVLTTMNAVDLAQDDIHIGFIGTHGNRVANMILAEADLIISVGARMGLRQLGRKKELISSNARVIRVEIDQNELSRNVKDDEEKHLMDAADYMRELLRRDDIPDYSEWLSKCMKAKDLLDSYDSVEGNQAIEKISSMLPDNPAVAVDIGQNVCWSAQSLHLKGEKGRILIGGSYGSMGCGLPYAIGASISIGKGTVYCITGDGGFQMNIQELETVVREKLPIKILILNNHVLGKIRETQAGNLNGRFAQTTASSGYTTPDFAKIAEAYGIKAMTLKSYQELDKATNWFSDDEACLININMPEDTRLIPKINWVTCVMKPELDSDMISMVESILKH